MPEQCKSVDELPLIVPKIIETCFSVVGIFYKAITFPIKGKGLEGLIKIFTCVEFWTFIVPLIARIKNRSSTPTNSPTRLTSTGKDSQIVK